MGDHADAILEGDVCHDCGVYLRGRGEGFPRWCRDCEREGQRRAKLPPVNHSDPFHVICPACNKRVKRAGLAQHTKDKHGTD